MGQIDSLLQALATNAADEVRLEVGKRIALIRGEMRKEISREPLKAPMVEKLIAEVFGGGSVLGDEKTTTLSHANLTIEVMTVGSGDKAVLSFHRDKAGGPASPTARRAAEQSPDTASHASTAKPPAMRQGSEPSVSDAPGATPGIDKILRMLVEKKGSDLHLSAGVHPVMRIHGEIHFLTELPVLSSQQIQTLVEEVMQPENRDQFLRTRDVDFAHEIKGLSRYRMNAFEDRNGVGCVVRTIPVEIVSAEKLGLAPSMLQLCYLTKGLVVVTGPTGSGKSTTLAAMVDFINRNRSDHLITIEDPIEFVHQNKKCLINQREVGRHTHSFKNALRAALREDPDVVLVGEMRDLETISIAIETAETGHLVFGTLHTTTAISTVDRIIDQFPPDRQEQIRVMLSESLKGVIAQVLLKKIGGGRIAAHEILIGTSSVANLIREGKTFQIASTMQTSRKIGMITMNESLFQLVKDKKVEPKEAWMKSVDKQGLIQQFKGAGIPTEFATEMASG